MEKKHTVWRIAATIITAAAGAFMSRWHGGGFISGSPKILKAFLWSFPFAAASVLAHWGIVWWALALVGVTVLAACMVFKNTGHGGGMDLAHSVKEPDAGREPEKLEYLILWLHGKMPQYWYDALMLAIIGLFSTLAPAIALGWVNLPAGIVMALGGLLGKPLGYMIGWALADAGLIKDLPYDFNHGTAVGEFLTGLFAYSALAAATWMVMA